MSQHSNHLYIASASRMSANFPVGEAVEVHGLTAAWCNTALAGHLKSKERLAETGLRAVMTITGMSADELSPSRKDTSALTFRRVADQETRNQLADVNATAYGLPNEPFREALALPDIWADDFAGYVACRDGQAVAAAATMAVDGSLHVMCVATVSTTLHATEDGLPAYLRMGYCPTATFTAYTRLPGTNT